MVVISSEQCSCKSLHTSYGTSQRYVINAALQLVDEMEGAS